MKLEFWLRKVLWNSRDPRKGKVQLECLALRDFESIIKGRGRFATPVNPNSDDDDGQRKICKNWMLSLCIKNQKPETAFN